MWLVPLTFKETGLTSDTHLATAFTFDGQQVASECGIPPGTMSSLGQSREVDLKLVPE